MSVRIVTISDEDCSEIHISHECSDILTGFLCDILLSLTFDVSRHHWTTAQILVNNFTYNAIANAAHSAVKKYDADTLSLDIKVGWLLGFPWERKKDPKYPIDCAGGQFNRLQNPIENAIEKIYRDYNLIHVTCRLNYQFLLELSQYCFSLPRCRSSPSLRSWRCTWRWCSGTAASASPSSTTSAASRQSGSPIR